MAAERQPWALLEGFQLNRRGCCWIAGYGWKSGNHQNWPPRPSLNNGSMFMINGGSCSKLATPKIIISTILLRVFHGPHHDYISLDHIQLPFTCHSLPSSTMQPLRGTEPSRAQQHRPQPLHHALRQRTRGVRTSFKRCITLTWRALDSCHCRRC